MIAFFTYGLFWFTCWLLMCYQFFMYKNSNNGKWAISAGISFIAGIIPLVNIYYAIALVGLPFIEAWKTGNWEYFK